MILLMSALWRINLMLALNHLLYNRKYVVWTKCSCTELTKNLISIILEWAHGDPQNTLPSNECTWPNAFSIVENNVACPVKLGSSEVSSFHV
jgi:hypothetical protein